MHTRLRVLLMHRHSLRPPFSEGYLIYAKLGRIAPRERERL